MTTVEAKQQAAGFQEQGIWLCIWVLITSVLLCLSFCITQRRRQLCWRRIKERRWIVDEGIGHRSNASVIRVEERRQRLEARQRRFQKRITQEDEIRQQYLEHLMEGFTMVSIVMEFDDFCRSLGRAIADSPRQIFCFLPAGPLTKPLLPHPAVALRNCQNQISTKWKVPWGSHLPDLNCLEASDP
jgi:hypothetical protein